jgi:hypothetical protein
VVSGFDGKKISARVCAWLKTTHIDRERAFAKADEERRRAEALGVEMVVRPADRAECGFSLAI